MVRPAMIASYSNNFIFLKTRKTAGTSVEVVLAAWCSGRDVIAPSEAAPRAGGAMNYRRGVFHTPFKKHDRAVEVRPRIRDLWDRAFKFTIERHPYERFVSRIYWDIHKRGWNPETDFQKMATIILAEGRGMDNRSIYCIDGKIAVDEVILYDNLWPRIAELAKQWGRAIPKDTPRLKGGHRPDHRRAHEILTDAQKERIYVLTRADFETFGFHH